MVKVEIRDLGPVNKGTIELLPMTIVIGRNNTGKSYSSQFIYAIHKSIREAFSGAVEFPDRWWRIGFDTQGLDTVIRSLRKKGYRGEEFATLLAENGINALIEQIKSRVLTELERLFAPNFTKMIRFGSKGSQFATDFSSIRVAVKIRSRKTIVEVHFNEALKKAIIDATKTEFGKSKRIDPFSASLVFLRMASRVIGPSLSSEARRPIYVIAERAGLLRIYRPLLSLYIRTSIDKFARTPSRELLSLIRQIAAEGSRISPITTDFLESSLLGKTDRIERRREPNLFREELQALEAIMEGKITLLPELRMVFRLNGGAIDFDRVSSMVTELTAIYLIVRDRLTTRDLLIIEEPEAHLHPSAQVALAAIFTSLVRKGVKILLTTHSTLMPIALAHMVGVSKLSVTQREQMKFSATQYLRPEELGIYLFKSSPGGTKIQRLKVHPTGRIPALTGMDEVFDQLYGEEAKLLELTSHASTDSE